MGQDPAPAVCRVPPLQRKATDVEVKIGVQHVGREVTFETDASSQEVAKAVAEGLPWLGHDSQAGGVLYLDAENPGPNFRQRLHAVGASLESSRLALAGPFLSYFTH